ncbi:hypothetical protein EE612_023269, partial [Oryza sativa]
PRRRPTPVSSSSPSSGRDHRSHVLPPPPLLHLRRFHRGVDHHHRRGIAIAPAPSCVRRVPGAPEVGNARARRRTPTVRRIATAPRRPCPCPRPRARHQRHPRCARPRAAFRRLQ